MGSKHGAGVVWARMKSVTRFCMVNCAKKLTVSSGLILFATRDGRRTSWFAGIGQGSWVLCVPKSECFVETRKRERQSAERVMSLGR